MARTKTTGAEAETPKTQDAQPSTTHQDAQPSTTHQYYTHCKVQTEEHRDNSDKVIARTFTSTKVLKSKILMEPHWIERLNNQAHNSGEYYFNEGETSVRVDA